MKQMHINTHFHGYTDYNLVFFMLKKQIDQQLLIFLSFIMEL